MERSSVFGDRGGSVDLIQFVLVLPIFVLILYGSFEVWKIVSVKQSLSAAAYQAARCRSIYNNCSGVDNIRDEETYGGDSYRCEWALLHELVNNSLIDEEDLLGVEIRYRDADGDLLCVVGVDRDLGPYTDSAMCPRDPTSLSRNAKFDVEASLFLPWPLFLGVLTSGENELPQSPTLLGRHRSYIECGPRWQPTPTPTPLVP